MRVKTLFLFFLLLFLLNAVVGCSENIDREGAAAGEEPGAINSAGAPGNGQPEALDEKTTGIILDSVVDVFREASTQSERVTQAIYNQPAEMLEEKDGWVKVKVADGYTGWIKSKYIDKNSSSLRIKGSKYRIVVTIKKSKILSDAKYGTVLKEVVMGTELYPVNSSDGWYEVALPGDKTGWLNESGTIQVPINEHISRTTPDDFVATAMKFKDTVYLWGGVSSLDGIDSQGLVYMSGRINGVDLPRDADGQYKCGKPVDKSAELLPGDLIFFSSNEDLKDISYVGIYIDGGQFLYASKSDGYVMTGLTDNGYFQKRLVGIRRIFNGE